MAPYVEQLRFKAFGDSIAKRGSRGGFGGWISAPSGLRNDIRQVEFFQQRWKVGVIAEEGGFFGPQVLDVGALQVELKACHGGCQYSGGYLITLSGGLRVALPHIRNRPVGTSFRFQEIKGVQALFRTLGERSVDNVIGTEKTVRSSSDDSGILEVPIRGGGRAFART